MNEIIRVTQLPVIVERLKEIRAEVEEKTTEALSLAVTEETLAAVKAVRADLNKQAKEVEDQRKAVKQAIMEPYNAFEAVYKENVGDLFKNADDALKRRIDGVELEMKNRCRDAVRAYFDEKCAAEHIDFINFDEQDFQISMTDAKAKSQPPKRLKEYIDGLLEKVNKDLEFISTYPIEEQAEIMVEYKRCLDLGAVVAFAKRRKEAEQEAERIKERQEALKIEQEAAAKVEAMLPPTVEKPKQETEREPEKVYQCSFTVTGTLEELKALKNFLTSMGYNYESR